MRKHTPLGTLSTNEMKYLTWDFFLDIPIRIGLIDIVSVQWHVYSISYRTNILFYFQIILFKSEPDYVITELKLDLV